VLDFSQWLSTEISVEIHLATIGKTAAAIRLTRRQFIKMCGNIAKHSPLRLDRIVKDLKKALDAEGTEVTMGEAMLALDDFYQRFHVDIFNYHGSTLAAFLNNIRWGIYAYLRPEFERSIVYEDKPPGIGMYRFTYPLDVGNSFAKARYWDLMNDVRDVPYVRKFEVTKCLKLRY
jgi:hypothetical protein